MLRSAGIRCGDRDADLNPVNTGGIVRWREILVSEDDLARARQLLDTPTSP
jgi:hypothetical protein